MFSKYKYPYSFYNLKLIYTLNTPFEYRKKNTKKSLRVVQTFNVGCFYYKQTCNNLFVTTTRKKTGNVVSSFSSKMFKGVVGKKRISNLILIKKFFFVIGVKSMMQKVSDIYIIIRRGFRRKIIKVMYKTLRFSGILVRRFAFFLVKAHNGLRGKNLRRI